MKLSHFLFLALLIAFAGCGDKAIDPSKPVFVKIKTTMGNVTIRLYDDTPLHRDNFIKLCQSGAQDGVLFHRIIKDFVVQGGDPQSKAHSPPFYIGVVNAGFPVHPLNHAHFFLPRYSHIILIKEER